MGKCQKLPSAKPVVGAGCVKCLFRATRHQIIPRGWMSNALNYLPAGFDHQLWLILVDIMAAVFGHKEACVRHQRCQFFVRRTEDRFQCVRRKTLRFLRQVERTRMGENCQRHRSKWRGRGRLAHHGVIFSVSDRLKIAVARDGLYRVAAGAHVESHEGRPPLRREQPFEHLGQLDFLHARENVVLLGPPGTGKSHLAIAISIRACLAGQRVAFATATEWVARLSEAKRHGSLQAELRRLGFVPLIVVDEVGYIPFDPEAANLMFSLISARYERASVIVTSNKPFSAWGEIFGDEVVAAAMIDRLVHHAEILGLKGDSYRLRDKDLGAPTPTGDL